MSEPDDAAASADPLVQPFLEYWNNYLQQVNQATKAMLGGCPENADPKDWQRQWLEAASRSMDAYLRSPSFLQLLKAHIDTLVETRRRANDLAGTTAGGHAGAPSSEAAALLARLSGVETTLLAKLAQIERRLEAIEHGLREQSDAG